MFFIIGEFRRLNTFRSVNSTFNHIYKENSVSDYFNSPIVLFTKSDI